MEVLQVVSLNYNKPSSHQYIPTIPLRERKKKQQKERGRKRERKRERERERERGREGERGTEREGGRDLKFMLSTHEL